MQVTYQEANSSVLEIDEEGFDSNVWSETNKEELLDDELKIDIEEEDDGIDYDNYEADGE